MINDFEQLYYKVLQCITSYTELLRIKGYEYIMKKQVNWKEKCNSKMEKVDNKRELNHLNFAENRINRFFSLSFPVRKINKENIYAFNQSIIKILLKCVQLR